MTRNDGLVGTARARFSAGKVESYDALWTDTAATPRRIMLSVVHDSLLIRDPSRADTVIPIPATSWGVADYAMNEFLVPVFLARSADDVSFPFAVYRPYARHWDTGIASVRRLGENFIASYRVGADTLDVTLLITGEGDLLLGENAGPTGAQRLPLEGSSRRAR